MNDIIIATGSGDGKFPEGLVLYYQGEQNGYGYWHAMHLIGDTQFAKIYHDYEKWILGYGDDFYFQSFQGYSNPVDVTVWDYNIGTPPAPTLQVYTPPAKGSDNLEFGFGFGF